MKSNTDNQNNRDGNLHSPWQAKPANGFRWNNQTGKITCDVLIIGGGITGVTTALMLQTRGKKCIIAEAHSIGFGTTSGTSAHINTFADTTFTQAEHNFGEKGAALFAEAINEGFSIIRNHIEALAIDCDFEMKDGYVYAEDEQQMKDLQELYEGTVKQNIAVNFSRTAPTPVPYKEALIFPEQAQFHPVRYLEALVEQYIDEGGVILENLNIDKIDEHGAQLTASGLNTTIRAKSIVYATHIPPGLNIFNTRCAPYRSYVLGVTLEDKNYPDALIYDMQEPYHYFRTHKISGRNCLIVGGNDHKTGHEDPAKAFEDLEKYVRKHYAVSEILYKWSSQYYVPVDGFPYIGQMPGMPDGVYCATGYNGNGMVLGSVAAKIIADAILEKANKYAEVFNPSRLKPVAGFKEFVKENADAAYQFVVSRFNGAEVNSLDNIKNDTGQIVELQGKQLAVYKDNNGNIHALNPVCTHAHCVVNWNGEEKSWDCPCHGARYDINGIVLNGPATKKLEKIAISS